MDCHSLLQVHMTKTGNITYVPFAFGLERAKAAIHVVSEFLNYLQPLRLKNKSGSSLLLYAAWPLRGEKLADNLDGENQQ